ncbi:hypothetical protein H7F10_13385 [Acidithiobacillus sp. HP-6]|uniref:hypothetical protein n=1 Tax=unclassified Acidithiobacillus TaxID=2614800 RepID=UPI001879D11B|nr:MULTISPECIES: hypothetical protein [unclassified Acidithiobacillus]MBE7563914.1 hypothetical protein [Acidithiobacillus sp. HP-6]MBE7569751.1 hypothetical protein [Acidithiobacillus sp. HP-2]
MADELVKLNIAAARTQAKIVVRFIVRDCGLFINISRKISMGRMGNVLSCIDCY